MKNRLIINIIFVILISSVALSIRPLLPKPGIEEHTECLTALQSKNIDLLIEMNKYLISIAIVIIGALGSIKIGKQKVEMKETLWTIGIYFTSILLSCVSLLFGYILYTKIYNLLAHNIVNMLSSQLIDVRNYQFLFLMLSTVFFLWYLLNLIVQQHEK